MKIYTRQGDDGSTGLLGPGRVAKSSPRVEAYGSVDELNASLGLARALDREGWLAVELETIQSQLFEVGAELATVTPALREKLTAVGDAETTGLERAIDRLERDLEPLASFIVPGGTELAAQLHLSRTVCRRAERRLVALARGEEGADVAPRLLRYLNRLGDLLFVMARWCNRRAGTAEIPWRSGRRTEP